MLNWVEHEKSFITLGPGVCLKTAGEVENIVRLGKTPRCAVFDLSVHCLASLSKYLIRVRLNTESSTKVQMNI